VVFDYTESGKRIHAYLADPSSDKKMLGLKDEEIEFAVRCWEQWISMLDKYFPAVDPATAVEDIVERRIFLKGPDGRDIFSGQLDRIMVAPKLIIGTDWKTGRIPVESVESNMQIRAYVVLIAELLGYDRTILMSIIQPWISQTPILVEYGPEEIKKAREELFATLRLAEEPNALRIPGEHCRYCPCRANCEEAKFVTMELSKVEPATLTSNDQIAAFLGRVSLAEKVIEAVKAEAKRRIEAGEVIPGWCLRPGRKMDEITDAELVFTRASNLGVTPQQFMSAVKIVKGSLKDAVKAATNQKGKSLDETMAVLLDGCVTEKLAASFLAQETKPSV